MFRSEFRMLESDREFEKSSENGLRKGSFSLGTRKVQAASRCTGLAERIHADRQKQKATRPSIYRFRLVDRPKRTEDNHDAEKT